MISVVEPIYYIIRLLTVDDEDAEDELETWTNIGISKNEYKLVWPIIICLLVMINRLWNNYTHHKYVIYLNLLNISTVQHNEQEFNKEYNNSLAR